MAPLDEADPRAVDALERLARSASASPPVRWPSMPSMPSVPSVRKVRTVAAAFAVVLVGSALVLAPRAGPFEDRMPVTQAEPPAPTSDLSPATIGPAASLLVHVAGAVGSPGVVELPPGSRVIDAVTAAGGLLPDADPDRLNLAAPLEDGLRVAVPVVGQPAPDVFEAWAAAGPGSDAASGAGVVNVNLASQAQLETLPGVGPATATAIIAHRDSNGPFRTVESLIDVRGIGEAKLDALRDLVTVG